MSWFAEDLSILVGAMRGRNGRFVSPDTDDGWAYNDAIDAAIERVIAERFASPNPRGNPELGTFRSKRKAADLRRERDRISTCVICGNELTGPGHRRSDIRTCSPKCRKALSRRNQVRTVAVEATKGSRHTSASRIEVAVTRVSPLTAAFLARVEDVFRVPMPEGYPDPVEWRRGQVLALRSLERDEHTSDKPSVTRYNRRARAYIRAQKRLTKED